jgi:hypothetical protein
MRVAENLLGSGVIEPEVVQSRPETFFRPLRSPELQIASMELIRKLEPVPDIIRAAVAQTSQRWEVPSTRGN